MRCSSAYRDWWSYDQLQIGMETDSADLRADYETACGMTLD